MTTPTLRERVKEVFLVLLCAFLAGCEPIEPPLKTGNKHVLAGIPGECMKVVLEGHEYWYSYYGGFEHSASCMAEINQ